MRKVGDGIARAKTNSGKTRIREKNAVSVLETLEEVV